MSESSVGPYRILEKLGSGGMGDVYLAEDPRLHRKVALKTLAGSWSQAAGARQRLLREARAAARLNHPNIAAIYDVIETADSAHIVMEYVEGEPLSHRLARGPLPPEQVTDVAVQLCDAIAAAHAHGVIHGDLKPGNVLLTRDGKAKVLDFGLAKAPAGPGTAAAAGDPTLDADGHLLGTPAYMAPEQLRRQKVDQRTDLYSLGVMLFELLTAQRPFKGEDVLQLGIAILNDPTPSPAQAQPAVPPDLSAIVSRAMAREPAERFQSALEMRAALGRLPRISEQTTLSALGVWNAAARGRRVRWRRALLVGAALAAFAGLLLFVGPPRWATSSLVEFAERDWLLIGDFENSSGESIFDESLREGLGVALNQSAHVNVFPRPRVADALRRMRRNPTTPIDSSLGREICRREGVKVFLTGAIRRSGNTFQIAVQAVDPVSGRLLRGEKEEFTAREEFFDRVDRLARRLRETLGESLARIDQTSRPLAKATTASLEALELYSKARELSAQGDVKSAAALLRKALEADADFAMAHRQLGSAALVLGDPLEAGRRHARAFELRQEVTDRERHLIVASYHGIRNEFEQAADALKVLTSLYPDDLAAHEELAVAYDSTGQVPKAIAELREVLRLDPFATQACGNLGLFLVTVGDFQGAIDVYQKATERGLSSPYFGWGLGLARLGLGDVKTARAEFAGLEREGPPYEALGRLYLARAAIYSGEFEEAREQLSAGLRSDAKTDNRPYASLRRVLRAQLSWLEGRRAAVAADLDPVLNAATHDLADAQLRDAGQLWARLGKTRQARKALERIQEFGGPQPSASNRSCLHTVEGEIALAEGRPGRAVELFLAAAAEYPVHFPRLGLARAYEAQADWRRAAEAWRAVLDSRGEILRFGFPADAVLAHWELARTQQKMGDTAAARSNYDAFLRLWNEDETSPIRQRAAREWRAIGGASPPSAGNQPFPTVMNEEDP